MQKFSERKLLLELENSNWISISWLNSNEVSSLDSEGRRHVSQGFIWLSSG